jgi:HK97 family phage major capsid protein
MNHIKDKKRWWAIQFCTSVTPAQPNRFDILGPIGIAALTVMIVCMIAATAMAEPSAAAAGYSLAVMPLAVPSARPMSMTELEEFLRRTASPHVRFRNDTPTIDSLRELALDLSNQMKRIQDKADTEKRGLTADEKTMIDNLEARFNSTVEDIDRRTRIAAASEKLSQPAGRKTVGEQPAYGEAARTRHSSENDDRKFGFVSVGEFGKAVLHASAKGAQNIDPRLIANAAPSTSSSEGTGADGGFLVPPDFRNTIMQKVDAEDDLAGRTDRLTTSSNNVTIPIDETTPWQQTGGIQAYWTGEQKLIAQSKVALESRTLELHKLTAMVPVTDELLEDAGTLTGYINKKAPEKIGFKVSDAILCGTGAGMPLGILAGAPKITVDKEMSQTSADPILFKNIVNMYSRLYKGCRKNAIWIINQDVEPQLYGMQFPGTGTAVPVFLPPGGLSGSPYATLFGKPIISHESAKELGTEGDIILTDLNQYLSLMKTQGLRQDVSIHLFFDYDVTAFRFILRCGGKPWWNNPITPKNGSNTRSCTVTLQTRS